MIARADLPDSPNERLDYDIIVIGGGPAGCAFVRSLLQLKSRLRVLLIDKERFPRDKVCGDGLTFQAIPLVAEIFPELASMTPSASFTDQHILYYPDAPSLYRQGQMLDAIPRIEFDNALWRATVAAGAETLEDASVTGLLVRDGQVQGVKLREGEISRELTCGLVVGADGSRSVVRRETGSTDDDYVIHSLRQYVRGIPESSKGFIFSFDTENLGYFWIFPFIRNGERWANIGYGNATNNQILKERFHHFCETPEMKRYLGDGQFQGNIAGFPLNLARFRWNGRLTRKLWGPGYLLLGDAAALIHPLTGEGISFAMESGRMAAEVLVDETIPPGRKGVVYERRVLRRVRPVFLSITAFCAIRLPSLLPRILSRALVRSVAFAQRHFGFAVGPIEPVQNIVTLEVALLFVLISAFAAFWAVQLWTPSALPVPYGTRAHLFAAITATFCLLDARRLYGWRFAFTFLVFSLISSLGIECIGTSTGNVFGGYRYAQSMPGQLFGLVPMVVPVSWFIIFYLSFATTAALRANRLRSALSAAIATALFVAYDMVADPNHIFRGGWSYFQGGAFYGTPLQNFVGCAAFGLFSFLCLGALAPREAHSTDSKFSFAAIAYVAVMLHEGLFALVVAGHRWAAAVAFAAVAAVVVGLVSSMRVRATAADVFAMHRA